MESWMPYVVVVTAAAVVLQAAILVALFVQVRRTAAAMERTFEDINVRLGPVISRLQLLVEDVSPRISGIVSDASDLTRLARGQAQKLDRVVSEALERLRLQLVHLDQMLTGAMEIVEDTGTRLKQTMWAPVVQATAVVRGIQTGLEFFRNVRSGRVPVEPPAEHRDEGMFI
jgi:hypothetical protein